jgi:lambda family phage minor tail protein L
MTFQADIASDVQKPAVGEMVFLYEIDLSELEAGTYLYFTEGTTEDNVPIQFNSRTYFPIQLETEGFDVTGEGQLPRPRIRVSNALLTFAPYVNNFSDILGAKFTRRRTLRKYLDDGSEANPIAEFPSEIFKIQQKTEHNKFQVEFELSAFMDFEGLAIPKRQIIRDFCSYQYRRWDTVTGQFIYADVSIQCPYGLDTAGKYSYTNLGKSSSSKNSDRCGKRFSDCELRFGGDAASRAKKQGKTVNIQTAEPLGNVGDYWLKIYPNPKQPDEWFRFNESRFWTNPKPDPLFTRAFPGVARFRGN